MQTRATPLIGAAMAAIVMLGGCGQASESDRGAGTTVAETGSETDDVALTQTSELCPDEGEEWEEAKLYIEHNATDEDTGVHGLFGGEAWQALCIWDPAGNQILEVTPLSQMRDLTISDFFFESREPPAAEWGLEDLMTAFPEGRYRVAGTDYSGVPRTGAATFTHDIPVQPIITTPALSEDPDELADPSVVPAGDLVVTWEPVTETLAGDEPEISGYEVIVTTEEFEDPDGLSRPVYDVHVGPDMTELTVPAGFLQPATLYELEVLALEVSGNQTISVGFFETED